jgi:hypothetical protein
MRRPILAAFVAVLVIVPVLVLRGQSTSDEPHGDLQLDCAECHNPEKWVPVDRPPTFRHATTGFVLESAHAKVSCRGCHRTLVFNRVGTACADCHKDSHRGEMGFQCESCHTPTTWTNQREMFRAHDRTRFPLLAAHSRLDCQACHRSQNPYQYKNTPAECGNCHLETWQQTTDPPHEQSGFSRRCEDCHDITSTTWRGARFSHPASFPLSGGHAGVACASCHVGGVYAGTSTACASCHMKDYQAAANPNHVAGRFPTTCESCHTIAAWRPATFNHDQSRFPLTGAHASVECARCHVGGRYTGTPTDCYSCHRADYARTSNPNHQAAGFPTQCESCHTTSAWRPASFDHDRRYFPIYSGTHRGRWTSCGDCHVNPGNYKAFECILCHAHSNKAEVDRDHREERGYVYASSACYQCHPNGRAD